MTSFDHGRLLAESDRHAVELIRRLEHLERTDPAGAIRWAQAADMARRARGPIVSAVVAWKVGA